MRISREALVCALAEHVPGLRLSYEPCTYPGVKIAFFHSNRRGARGPVCPGCSGYLLDGTVPCGECHKVTISCFRSGSVIITGARSMAQCRDAYAFITGFLAAHRAEVEVPAPPGRRPCAV